MLTVVQDNYILTNHQQKERGGGGGGGTGAKGGGGGVEGGEWGDRTKGGGEVGCYRKHTDSHHRRSGQTASGRRCRSAAPAC